MASFVRLPFLAEIKRSDITCEFHYFPPRSSRLTVQPGNITRAAIWINTECNIGIVCSNLPLLRPVILATVPPSIRSKFSISVSSFGFSSNRRKRTPPYRLSDEEAQFGSLESGGSGSKGKMAVETVRHKIEPSGPRKGHSNWFSRQGTLDDGDDDAEEMVPVSGRH